MKDKLKLLVLALVVIVAIYSQLTKEEPPTPKVEYKSQLTLTKESHARAIETIKREVKSGEEIREFLSYFGIEAEGLEEEIITKKEIVKDEEMYNR